MECNQINSVLICQRCGRSVDSDGDCLICEKVDLDIAQDNAFDVEAEED